MNRALVWLCVMVMAVSAACCAWAEDFGSMGGDYSAASIGSDGGSGSGGYERIGTVLTEMGYSAPEKTTENPAEKLSIQRTDTLTNSVPLPVTSSDPIPLFPSNITTINVQGNVERTLIGEDISIEFDSSQNKGFSRMDVNSDIGLFITYARNCDFDILLNPPEGADIKDAAERSRISFTKKWELLLRLQQLRWRMELR
jgi:hypothetical protein